MQAASKDGKSLYNAKSAGYNKTYIGQVKISKAENKPTGVKLTWGKVGGAAAYRIFYKTGSGDWTKIADTTSTSYTWTKAKSGTKYTFAVQVVSKDGKSLYNAKSASYNKTYIGQVKISKAENKPEGVKLTWSKVGGAAAYRVFYKTGSGDRKKIADTTATSYTWTSAKSGTKYTFAVQAASKDGKSLYNAKSDGFNKTYIGQVKISKAENKPEGVKLTWSAVGGAAAYRVFYKTGSGAWTTIGDTTATSYTWTKAQSGTKYTFAVQVASKDGKGVYNAKSASYNKTYIGQVKISGVSDTGTGIKITWGKVGGAAAYRVFYKTGSGDWKKLTDTTKTSYTWTKAKSGTQYTFAVQVVSKDGKSLYNAKSDGQSITYKQQAQFSIKTGAYQDTRDNYETYALFVTDVTDSTITFSVFAYRWTSIIGVTGKISGNKVTFANENVEGYLTLSDNGKIVMTLTSANDMYIGKGVFTYKYFGTATDYWAYYDRLQLLRNDDTYGWHRVSDVYPRESEWNCDYDSILLRFFDDGTFTYWLGTYDALMYEDFEKFRGTYEVKETVDDRNHMITKLYLNGDEYELVLAGTFTMDIDATGNYATDLSGAYVLEKSDLYIGLNRYY